MLKRIRWRLIFSVLASLACLSGLVVLMSFIEVKKDSLECREVKVQLPGNDNFIEHEEVDRILFESGGTLVGRKLNEINIHKLENILKANPFIEYAKIFSDMNGVIYVDIRQRKPVVRVINMANVHFYIDEHGLKIPMSQNFTARVLVANGLINEDFSGRVDTLYTPLARDLFKIASYIRADTLWNDQIEQVFVNLHGDIEIVPRVGDHRIILGTADMLEKKFRNLRVFYKQALPRVGWTAYKTINLKYANQIVCEKNDNIDSISNNTPVKVLSVVTPAIDSIQLTNRDSIIN